MPRNITMAAHLPCSAARLLAATIFSRFPLKSPTVGLICASAIFTLPV